MRLRILCLVLLVVCITGCWLQPERSKEHDESTRKHARAGNEMAGEVLDQGTEPGSPLAEKLVTSTGLVRNDMGEPAQPLDWRNDPAYLASVSQYESQISEYKVRMKKYEDTIGKWKRRWDTALNIAMWGFGIASLFGIGGAGVAKNVLGKLKSSRLEAIAHKGEADLRGLALGTMIKASQGAESGGKDLKKALHNQLDKFMSLDGTKGTITSFFNLLKKDNQI